MNEQQQKDAAVALLNWFETQGIAIDQAVLVMCSAISACIPVINPAHEAEGRRVIANMILDS